MALLVIPIIYLVYNIFYALSAYPAGVFSDKAGRAPILLGAFLLFALINASFAFVDRQIYLWLLFALYGLVIGLTDGVFKAFVADLAVRESEGEAFGLYHMVTGLATLIGNVAAGFMWQAYGSQWPFLTSAFLILLAGALIFIRFRRHNGQKMGHGVQNFKAYRN
jgi:MFS family permease